MTLSNTAVWLYGSCARGDVDQISDVDLLVVADQRGSVTIDEHVLAAQVPSDRPRSTSRYSWREIEGMSAYGSLFLHHVKAEGMPLFEADSVSGKLRSYLSNLRPYMRIRQDVDAFRLGLQESRESLSRGGSILFELSVIATLIRHSSILGCYNAGYPTFGRNSAVQKFVAASGVDPLIAEEYPQLYCYKLFAEGRVREVTSQNIHFALKWCQRLDNLLSKLEVQVG